LQYRMRWQHRKRRFVMAITSISNSDNYAQQTTAAKNTQATASTTSTASTATTTDTSDAAVYTKGTSTKKGTNQIYNRDSIISQLKADQQSRISSMQTLVENLLGKQAGTFDLANSTNLADTFRQAAKAADPQTIADAKDSISEDGYWGVNKTSDRMVSMAIALSGGDTSKADEMMAAIEKGYKKATSSWGEKLPQISEDTMKATRQKMSDWKNGVTTASDYSDNLGTQS
jgi:hypothetical protein